MTAEWDRLILNEDGGILVNDTAGVSTINQRAKSILCGTGPQGCTVNDRCCKCATGSCNTEKTSEDLTVALEKIAKSSALGLGQVANTLYDLIVDIKTLFKKTAEILSRETLAKNVAKTFSSFEKIISIQNEAIGSVTGQIIDMYRLIRTDLEKHTKARTLERKNSAASDLGHHIIFLFDITAELSKIASGVCNVADRLCEGIYSVTLVTTTVLFFVEQTLAANAIQVNKVGFRNDTASHICSHVSSAVDQYVFVIEGISECTNIQSLKELLPTVASSLATTRSKLSYSIGSATGFTLKYPVSPPLFGIVDSITACIRRSKHLKDAEAAISETIFSLFDVSKSILAARFSCSSINGFTGSVEVTIRKVLIYLNTIFFMIANIDDDCFSCGNNLVMLLATMSSIVLKVMCSIEEVMQSILGLGEITKGSSSLISVFEAVVGVTASVIQSVAFIFTELNKGSNLINLSKTVPIIMIGAKSQIVAARDRLNQSLETCDNDRQYNADTFIEASLVIESFNGFKHNVADVVSNMGCSKGDDTVDLASTTKIDKFIGKLKSSAKSLSNDCIGRVIAEAVNEICDELYDTLIQLSTFSLEKGEVLKLICIIISNYHFAFVTLNSIFNCSRYGTNASVF